MSSTCFDHVVPGVAFSLVPAAPPVVYVVVASAAVVVADAASAFAVDAEFAMPFLHVQYHRGGLDYAHYY